MAGPPVYHLEPLARSAEVETAVEIVSGWGVVEAERHELIWAGKLDQGARTESREGSFVVEPAEADCIMSISPT